MTDQEKREKLAELNRLRHIWRNEATDLTTAEKITISDEIRNLELDLIDQQQPPRRSTAAQRRRRRTM